MGVQQSAKQQQTVKQSCKTYKYALKNYMKLSVSPDLTSNPDKYFAFTKKNEMKMHVFTLHEFASLKFTSKMVQLASWIISFQEIFQWTKKQALMMKVLKVAQYMTLT